jgi:DNA-binding NarL/FixJ family response regulator
MLISFADLRKLIEAVATMGSAKSLAGLHELILTGLSGLVPGDCYDLVLCREADGDFHAKADTYTADEMAFMLAHAGEHPIARAYAAGVSGAARTSQFASDRVWRSSRLFREGGYRRLGLRHEVAVDIPDIHGAKLAALSIVRTHTDFSDVEMEILNLIRPSVARAWQLVSLRHEPLSPGKIRLLFPILSMRESEVLYWILEGKLNAEIAIILERRLSTIQEHVENIMLKLGMENRHQLTVRAIKACIGRGA